MSASPDPIPVNAARFDGAELARITEGRASSTAWTTRGISTDTRTLERGQLFVALQGERDGHAFLEAARERGACAAIVGRGRTHPGLPCIEVEDPLRALCSIARAYRRRSQATVVGIGGAAGKTTTTMICGALLQRALGAVHRTRGNQNNELGVAMTILAADPEADAWLVECGTSLRGEMGRIASMLEPDIAVLINVSHEHVEGMGGLESIAEEEGALLASAGDVVLANGDDGLAVEQLSRARCERSTFGRAGQAVQWLGRDRRGIGVRVGHLRDRVPLALPGDAAAMDACAALAAALAVTVDPELTLTAAHATLPTLRPPPGRFAMHSANGVLVIDDAYNANPASMLASLETAHALAQQRNGRLLVILGDMLELGDVSVPEHARVARRVARCAKRVVVVGPTLASLMPDAIFCDSSAAAADAIMQDLRAPDVVLVKGSRAFGLERAVRAIRVAREAESFASARLADGP